MASYGIINQGQPAAASPSAWLTMLDGDVKIRLSDISSMERRWSGNVTRLTLRNGFCYVLAPTAGPQKPGLPQYDEQTAVIYLGSATDLSAIITALTTALPASS